MHKSAAALGLTALILGACGSRTGLEGYFGSDGGLPGSQTGPEVSCDPLEAWTTIGRRAVLGGTASDDGWLIRWEWTVIEKPPSSNTEAVPALSDTTSIIPDTTGDFRAQLTVTDNDYKTATCEAVVHSVTGPPVAFCPVPPPAVLVGQSFVLEGGGFDDERIESYQWVVTERPPDSVAAPVPAHSPQPGFTPDVPGSYELVLTVTDNDGETGQCTLSLEAKGPPELVCPPAASAPTRQRYVLSAQTVEDDPTLEWSWEILEAPPLSTATLSQATSSSASLIPDRAGIYRFRVTVTDVDGFQSSCEVTLEALSTDPDALCPDLTTTTPLTEVELRGRGVDDGSIVGWEWKVLQKPSASSAAPPQPPDRAVTRFVPDVAGRYLLELTVVDDSGEEASCQATVEAIPGEGLRIEMYWNAPDRSCDTSGPPCDPTDVDLHLLHPRARAWFAATERGDCYYANCLGGLEWDRPGSGDNPRLDLDDVEGFGPENINIDVPVVDHEYTVGVHYFSDDDSGLPAEVFVRIYCGTIRMDPVYVAGPVTLRDHGSSYWNDFWRVATIVWDGRRCTVTPLTADDGGPDIILARDAELTR